MTDIYVIMEFIVETRKFTKNQIVEDFHFELYKELCENDMYGDYWELYHVLYGDNWCIDFTCAIVFKNGSGYVKRGTDYGIHWTNEGVREG
jgi:hypothetical protein